MTLSALILAGILAAPAQPVQYYTPPAYDRWSYERQRRFDDAVDDALTQQRFWDDRRRRQDEGARQADEIIRQWDRQRPSEYPCVPGMPSCRDRQ